MEILKLNRIDLQLFAGEKTEEATPKRKEDARKKGQVGKSVEIPAAVVLLVSFIALKLYLPYMLDELQKFTKTTLLESGNMELTLSSVNAMTLAVILLGAKLVLPIMAAALVSSVAINYIQVGFMFTTEPIMPKFEKLNPIEGFKRIFSLRSVVELVKSLLKITVIGYVTFSEIKAEFYRFPKLINMDVYTAITFIGNVAFTIILKAAVVLLIIAVLDFIYQRYEFNKSLKMSKQEIKEEYKQIEGDPHIKGKIKERQRAMAQRRMLQDVPKADVVITNPTHYAIAIKYDGKSMAAPVLVAKGLDQIALKIKAIAQENKVVTVENRPLAQALYKSVEIGHPIPPDLFQAVAEVLAFVYRLKGKV
jgi:flagellar biosynthesis protein FlhB